MHYTSTLLKDLIHITDTYAEIEMPFRGTAVNGMLLWLDENLMKQWCNLSYVKIEPQPGGMFYLTWAGKEIHEDRTVYGVIDEIDTERNSFKIKKVICVLDEQKLSGLEIEVSFSKDIEKCSSVKMRVSHSFDRYIKPTFDKAVEDNWPKTFSLFKEFIEN